MATPLLAQNRGTAEATVKGKKISINYGRPSLKGRDMLSKASTGTVWRLGMDQATEIETAGNLKSGSAMVQAGKYTLWAKKTGADTWVLAFHPKTGVWGAPPLKDGFIAEFPLKMEKASDSAEQLTIALAEDKGKGWIKIHWGTAVLSGAFDVN
ncbi:MAG: DUF2911 domain-containing protein [Blastocatellia bacterium]|nr:DUF2911 domain-containing protein [Blastocatellia bacterium]